MQRKIIHIDMDCFYAAIETRNNPRFHNKPLAVGGKPEERGVICTCNYLARKYGVHSAMPSAKALQLCSNLIILKPNMSLYKKVSQQIQKIFYDFTDLVEPLSLDEAFLDVTNCREFHGSATLIAQEIQQRIFAAQKLTASAGVAPNKFLAKVASDWRKPNGLFVITPKEIKNFMHNLPVNKIFGVGRVTAKKLSPLGIKTCGEMQHYPLDKIVHALGNFGAKLHELSYGIDNRPVETNRVRKSLSVEKTFTSDIQNINACHQEIISLHHELKRRLAKLKSKQIAKQFIKIKFNDFTQITRECSATTIALSQFLALIEKGTIQNKKPIRLIGIGVRFHDKPQNMQLPLV